MQGLEYGARESKLMKTPICAALLVAGEPEASLIRAIHVKLKYSQNSYGAKYGEAEFAGWQMQTPNLVGFTQTPGSFAWGEFGGHVLQPGLPAVPTRSYARGGGGRASAHYSLNPAHAPSSSHDRRGLGYLRHRGIFGRSGRGARVARSLAAYAPVNDWRLTTRTGHAYLPHATIGIRVGMLGRTARTRKTEQGSHKMNLVGYTS